MRAVWSGAIGFGLVNIPIKLYAATQESALDLDMLDKRGFAHIRYARINTNTGKEVPWGDIVKGYKLDDQYVVLTDDDFEKVSPRKSKMIDINEFVKADVIDTTFYDTPYYIEPSKGGEKAYALLRESLKESNKIAIGVFILRTKENLCILRPLDNMLLLQKLRFPEEIRKYDDLNIPGDIAIKPAEMKMAQMLIDKLTPKKFIFSKYKDTYDEELMKIIIAKAKGKAIKKPVFKIVHNKGADIMAQLKESLNTSLRKRKKAS